MDAQEIIILILAFSCGGSLSLIQIRRIFRGELRMYGLGAFKDATKIQLDKFDKRMLFISGISFVLLILLGVVNTI